VKELPQSIIIGATTGAAYKPRISPHLMLPPGKIVVDSLAAPEGRCCDSSIYTQEIPRMAVSLNTRHGKAHKQNTGIGATEDALPAESAKDADLILTNVTGTTDVEEALRVNSCVVYGSPSGGICIDFPTTRPCL